MVLRGHEAEVMSVCFFGADFLASGDGDGTLRLWRLTEAETVASVSTAHGGQGVVAIRSCPDDETRVLSLGRDGSLRVWDIGRAGRMEECGRAVDHLGGAFCGFDVLEGKGSWSGFLPIATSFGERSEDIVVVDRNVGYLAALKAVDRSWGMCTSVAFIDQVRIASGHEDGCVREWDLRTCRVSSQVSVNDDPIFTIASHPVDQLLVAAGASNTITSICCNSSPLQILQSQQLKHAGVSQLRFRPDGRVLSAACWDGKVRIFGSKAGKKGFLRPLASLRFHDGNVHSVDATMGAVPFASGGEDRRIALWNVFSTT